MTFTRTSIQNQVPSKDRPKIDRRRAARRQEDRLREQAHQERARKLHSLLELGQIIGLDLQLNEMLLQIAQKACEVMEADRCSVFLYDSATDELWSTVAMGMGGEVIRMSSKAGIGGHSFQAGEVINLEDAYTDPTYQSMMDEGLRVMAFAFSEKKGGVTDRLASDLSVESELTLVGLIGLEDPPRPEVQGALKK